MPNVKPNAAAFEFSDPWVEMQLIRETCDAEDAAREVCAPYGEAPTLERLEQVRSQLSQLLGLHEGRGRHVRMDVVLSLRTKLADVEARVSAVTDVSVSADAVA